MAFEDAIYNYLAANRETSYPEVQSIHILDINKVDDTCFIQIIPLNENSADTGNNKTEAITQDALIVIYYKIGMESTPTQIKIILDGIGVKVKKSIKKDLRLNGFLVSGKSTNTEKGSTVNYRGDKCRYYRITLQGKYFREAEAE